MAGKVSAPAGLSARAARVWVEVTGGWELRPDELSVLEEACREMDQVAALQAVVDSGPLMVEGSMGQLVVHPAVQEVRQHRALLAALWKRLGLPDEKAGEAGGKPASVAAREAARSRWAVHHGAAG